MIDPGAPPSTGPVGEHFRLGRVVARSFAIWARELPLLLALALVVHAPRVACVESLYLAIPELPPFESEANPRVGAYAERTYSWLRRAVPIQIASSLLGTLFRDLSLAVVIFAVYARLRGEQAAFGASLRRGLRRFVPVLRVSLLLFLLRAALLCGIGLLLWRLAFRHALGGLVLAIALLEFAIPALISLLLNPFWAAVPAAVVEEPRRPLRRSWRLTRGHRLAVCAILLVLLAIDQGSGWLLRLGLGSTELPWLARTCIWWTQDLLMVSLGAVFAAVGYHALRLEKDGVDVSDLERVFA